MNADHIPNPANREKQLAARLQQVESLAAQRGLMQLGEFLDALGYTKQLAAAGHPGAKANLRRLADELRTLDAAAVGIKVAS